jgi:transketolase
MRNTFLATLLELAAENPKLWLLCGDLGYSVLEPFAARFPDRYINVGVAEQNMAGIAAGLALSGQTVFIYSIGNFPTLRCLEQLRNDVCYHRADVKIVAVGAGYAYGSQGYTHHALEDVAIMSTLPSIEVFVPCDPLEVRATTRAIAASGRPSYLRLSRAGEPDLHEITPDDPRRLRMLREGGGTVLLAAGPIAEQGLQAASLLEKTGIDIKVISVCCIKPLPEDEIRRVARNASLVVTLEEHVLRGGLHSLVAVVLAGHRERPSLLGLGIPELNGKPSVAGSREALLARAGLSAEAIADRIRQALSR